MLLVCHAGPTDAARAPDTPQRRPWEPAAGGDEGGAAGRRPARAQAWNSARTYPVPPLSACRGTSISGRSLFMSKPS